jgi:hypothetical protein
MKSMNKPNDLLLHTKARLGRATHTLTRCCIRTVIHQMTWCCIQSPVKTKVTPPTNLALGDRGRELPL